MPDVALFWVAPADADANTDYRIESDKGTSGTFIEVSTEDATDRGDGSYAPYATTLNGALSATAVSITLTDATNFADGDYAMINREIVYLDGKSGNTFATCLRGVGGTLPVAHDTGAAVKAAHETYVDSAVDFGSRSVIRYKVIRIQGANESVAGELIAVYPPPPPYSNLVTLYGVLEDIQGNPQSGIAVTLVLNDTDNFGIDTGEGILKQTETDTSDADGFFHFFVRRPATHSGPAPDGAGILTLTIGADVTWSVDNLPDDVDYVNYLET